jgi:triosephosphate isomerase
MRAIDAGLIPIVCVGETLQDREAGRALKVVEEQVKESTPDPLSSTSHIIAYEPVWAIGTGRTPVTDDIARVHAYIAAMTPAPILYGGSVNPVKSAASRPLGLM